VVILFFEEQYPKQKSCYSPKIKHFAPPYFWAGYATDSASFSSRYDQWGDTKRWYRFVFRAVSRGHRLSCTQHNSNGNHNQMQISIQNFVKSKESHFRGAKELQVADTCSSVYSSCGRKYPVARLETHLGWRVEHKALRRLFLIDWDSLTDRFDWFIVSYDSVNKQTIQRAIAQYGNQLSVIIRMNESTTAK